MYVDAAVQFFGGRLSVFFFCEKKDVSFLWVFAHGQHLYPAEILTAVSFNS